MKWLPWLAAFMVGVAVGLPKAAVPWWDGGVFPDAVVDKYVTVAAIDGFGAHRPFDEIAMHYSVPGDPWTHRHPRPPGALIAQLPLLLVPDRGLLAAIGMVTAISTVTTFWATARIAGWGTWIFAGLAAWLQIWWDEWMRGNVWWMLTGALVTLGWVGVREGRRWGPWLIGVAAAAKLWPFLVIGGLSFANRRAAAHALITATVLSGFGLLFPGVSFASGFGGGGALEFLTTNGNLSLARFFAQAGIPWPVIVGGVVGLGFWAAGVTLSKPDVDQLFGVSIVGGLLASPLSWPLYWSAALPVLALIVTRFRPVSSRRTVSSSVKTPHLAEAATPQVVAAQRGVTGVGLMRRRGRRPR